MYHTTPTHNRTLDEIYARLKHQLTVLGQQLDEQRRGQVPAAESCARMRRTCHALQDAADDFDRRIPR